MRSRNLPPKRPHSKTASWDEPFEVITDASNIAIGTVLQQNGRPVAFFSKKLDDAQRNYLVYDKELYAVFLLCNI